MLILPIEKEIETDHKIVGQFNLRQVIALAIAIASFVVFYSLLGSILWGIICAIPFVFIAAILGWYTKNGLMVEDLALKVLQLKIYKNGTRNYRTKNLYFSVFNKAYADKRARERKQVEMQKKGRENNGKDKAKR